jgi:hemerythrin superfamily protein
MAKKAAKRKRTAQSSARKTTTRKPQRRAAKKAKAAKRTAAKRKPTKAARQKTAARAAASRNKKPAPPKSRFESAAAIARGAGATVVAAISKRLPWAQNENDPIVLLETDHRRFEKLLDEGEQSTERAIKGRAELLATIARELTVHEAIEERLLYPALKPHVESRQIVLEGFEEHHIADVIIKELKSVATSDEKWGAKFKVLKENITHHIQEEERMMFPTARGVLPREEFLALGARMRALKAELER